MWCLSKGSQSTKLRQSTRNQGSSTTRLQSCQNRQQKPKSHNKSHRRLQYRNTQIQIQIRKNQKQSTLKSYCKNPRQRSQRPAKRQADQHKGHQNDQAKGPSPPRNSRRKVQQRTTNSHGKDCAEHRSKRRGRASNGKGSHQSSYTREAVGESHPKRVRIANQELYMGPRPTPPRSPNRHQQIRIQAQKGRTRTNRQVEGKIGRQRIQP